MSDEPPIGWTEALGSEAGNPSDERGSGEVLHALGKEWIVSSCENRVKAQFEQWIRSNASQSCTMIEMEEGPEAGSAMRAAYLESRGAGHYNWGGRAIRQALVDVPGLSYLMFLLLRRNHRDVTPQQCEAMFRDNVKGFTDAVKWALGNSEAPPEKAGNKNQTTSDDGRNGLERIKSPSEVRITPERQKVRDLQPRKIVQTMDDP